jgi:purine-binding chemotaxis protein CheW
MEDFCELMGQREQDHRNWLRALEKSLAEGTEFRLARDPRKCAFGQWYYSYRSESPWITGLLGKFEPPHNKIHALASSIDDLMRKGKNEEALRLIESARNGLLQEMVSLFEQLKVLMRETVKELAMIISLPQGTLAISIDRAVAVELIQPEMIKDVGTDPYSNGSGLVHRAVQRNAKGALAMILEPDLFFDCKR